MRTKLSRIGSPSKRPLMGSKTEEKAANLLTKFLLKMMMNRLVMTKFNLRLWGMLSAATQTTKAVIKMERSMAKARTLGRIILFTLGILLTITLRAKVCRSGQMDLFMMGIGKTARCKDKGCSFIQTEISTWANIPTTTSKVWG